MWRPADEALLSRLENEAAMERAWALLAPEAAPLPARAAGLLAVLWQPEERAAAIVDDARLRAALEPASLSELSPAAVHHLALVHERRAREAIARGWQEGVGASISVMTAAWLRLARERAYLERLARDVLGASASERDVEQAIARAALRGVELARAIAAEGARDRSSAHAPALAALRAIDRAVARAGAIDDELGRTLEHAARQAVMQVVGDLLTPIELELGELEARAWQPTEVRDVLERAHEAWQWSGRDPELEHLVVRAIPSYAWDLYRARRWTDMRTMIAPIEPLADSLEARVTSDPSELAWAAPCAQVIVFRAELATTLDAQIALAERGHRLCPSLRNGRLVLADLLCARAERVMDAGGLLGGRLDAVFEDVKRAAELYPPLKRLPQLRERLARRGKVVP